MSDIKEYLKQTKTVLLTQDAFDELMQRASTQPEIVRCKDCKYLDIQGTYGECGKGILGVVNRGDFCSRAERREG